MALTELQLPTKVVFYAKLQAAATEMDRIMIKWQSLAEFVGNISTDDLDTMTVASGQVRTDLGEFRTMIDEVISLWEGNAVTPTNTPSAVVDKIRSM